MTAETSIKTSRLIEGVPFFYGWVILAVGTIGNVMIGPSQTFTVGIFIDAFIVDLGISRANVSLIYGLSTFGASLMLPLTGRLVDRYGVKRMMIAIGLGLGLACIGMAWVQGLFTIFVGFLFLRFMGFGSLQLVSSNAIAQWFIRQRGFVMGLAGLSLALSLTIFPVLTQYLIDQFAWRGAWMMLGVLVWVTVIPLGGFFIKDRPEKYGLLPDGDPQPQPGTISVSSEVNWLLPEARRTKAFWLFLTALSTITMLLGGLVFHQISLFEVRGLDRETAIGAFQITALFTVVGNLSMGRLLDKFPSRFLLAISLFLLTGAMFLVQMIATPFQAFLYAAMVGLISGNFRVLDSVIWAKYFGRLHLGAIKGATMMGTLTGTAIGPYLLGVSMDYLGSYRPALMFQMVIPLTIGIIAFFVKRPHKAS